MISPVSSIIGSLGEAGSTPAETSPVVKKSNPFPAASIYDALLHQWHENGFIDERAQLAEENNGTLFPPLPPQKGLQLQHFFYAVHQMTTKDRRYLFPLHLPNMTMSALKHTQCSYYLVGGSTYTFMSREYAGALGRGVDPNLEDIPPEYLADFGQAPHDYDLRVYIHKPMSKENFEELKNNIIQALAFYFYGQQPYNEALWLSTVQFVKQNCFKKLKIEFTEKNQFLITTFANGDYEIDILWVGKLERSELFYHNALNIPLPQPPNFTVPFSLYRYQSVLCKMARIIQASDIDTIDYKGWFLLLTAFANYYRCYVQDLEKTVLRKALGQPIEGDRLKWLEMMLKLCLVEHLDKTEDPAAHLCLTLGACRSLHAQGEADLANQLFGSAKTRYPKEGFTSLFQGNSPWEVHYILLQLFGVLCHDGQTILETKNEFAPALHFVLPGRSASFTFLLPLKLEAAIAALPICAAEIDRYIDFFKGKLITDNTLIEKIPLNLLLQNADNKVCFLLLIAYSLQKKDWSHLDTVLASLFTLNRASGRISASRSDIGIFDEGIALAISEEKSAIDDPTGTLLKAAESYFKAYLQDEQFSFGKGIALNLFELNLPHLTPKVFTAWRGKIDSTEEIKEVLPTLPLAYKIKLLRHLDSEEVYEQIGLILPHLKTSSQKTEHLNELNAIVRLAAPTDNPALLHFITLYFDTFGYQPDLPQHLAKTNNADFCLTIALKLIDTHPQQAKKIWESKPGQFNKQQEADFLYNLFMKTEEGALLERLDRSLLGKEQKKIEQWIEKQDQNTPLLLSEFHRSFHLGQWEKARAFLVKLLNLKTEGIPKLPLEKITESLLAHPNILCYLTGEEYVQAVTANQYPHFLDKGLEHFPTIDPSLNKAFLLFYMKHKGPSNAKVDQFLLETDDPELVEAGFVEKPAEEHMKKYLQVLGAKENKIRKIVTKDFLEALPKEFTVFIGNFKEKKEWITLLFEHNVAHLYPVVAWMEEEEPSLSLIAQCRSLPLSEEESRRVQTLLQKVGIEKSILPQLILLYIHFNLLDAPSIRLMLQEALKIKEQQKKRQVADALEPHRNKADLEGWLLMIKLLAQLKEEKIVDYLKDGALPYHDKKLYSAVDQGAALLQNGSLDRLIAHLHFKVKHDLVPDAPFLRLLAGTGKMPLLIEALKLVFDHAAQYRPKEIFSVLEAALKSAPKDNTSSLFDLLIKNLLPLIVFEDADEIFTFMATLCTYPEEPMVLKALELLDELLQKKFRRGAQTIHLCVELGMKSSDKSVRCKLSDCLARPHLATFINPDLIAKYRIDLIEQQLALANNATDAEAAITQFLGSLNLMDNQPLKEKQFISSSLDLIIKFNKSKSFSFSTLLTKVTLNRTPLTREIYSYFKRMMIVTDNIDLTRLPSNQNDSFIENALLLTEKLLRCPDLLDKDHIMYNYLLWHMQCLVDLYPQNKNLAPLLYRLFLLQLPSGYDLTAKISSKKVEILHAAVDNDLFSNHAKECNELFCFLTLEDEVAEEDKLGALKNIVFRLAKHPHPAGAHLACQLVVRNHALFFRLEQKLIKFLFTALIDAIDSNYLQHEVYTSEIISWLLHTYGEQEKGLALELYRRFIDRIFNALDKEEVPSLLARTFDYLIENIQLFTDDYGALLAYLDRFCKKCIQYGQNTEDYTQFPWQVVKHLLESGLREKDPQATDKFIGELLSSLEQCKACLSTGVNIIHIKSELESLGIQINS